MKRYSLKHSLWLIEIDMGLLPDTHNCELRMHRVCRKRFSHHRLQRKPIVSYPGMHHGTCVTHVLCCMSGSLTRGGGENVPGACATHNFAYPVRGPTGHNSHRKVGVGVGVGGGYLYKLSRDSNLHIVSTPRVYISRFQILQVNQHGDVC